MNLQHIFRATTRAFCLVLGLSFIANAGCIEKGEFACDGDNSRCISEDEVRGTCEPTGYCSYQDSSCGDPLSRRYSNYAGIYSLHCVPPTNPDVGEQQESTADGDIGSEDSSTVTGTTTGSTGGSSSSNTGGTSTGSDTSSGSSSTS